MYTLLKLINGEIIFTEIEYEDDEKYCIKNPITFEISEEEGFVFKSWLAFVNDNFCLLHKNHVLTVLGEAHHLMATMIDRYLNKQKEIKEQIVSTNQELAVENHNEKQLSFNDQLQQMLDEIEE